MFIFSKRIFSKKIKEKFTKTETVESVENSETISQKPKVIKTGTRKVRVTCLWVLLIASSGFGLYRNFTATDTHTVYHETVVEARVQSTVGVENFVERFARAFFSYSSDRTILEERLTRLQNFMTDDLINLNRNKVTNYLQIDSRVRDVFIWSVTPVGDAYFDVVFSVVQNWQDETGAASIIENAFSILVYVNELGDMVITRKSFASAPVRADYTNTGLFNDGNISGTIRNEILAFLELFFGIYPSATRQQLSFYMAGDVLVDFPVLDRELRFNRLINPVFSYDGGYFVAEVSVEYFCFATLTNLTVTYKLRLEQVNDNFMIVGSY